MKAIRAKYENGEIKLLEPVPNLESTEVLVIFPADKEGLQKPARLMTEAELFGCGKDLWTDEVDAAVREMWAVRTRPWEANPDGDTDASI